VVAAGRPLRVVAVSVSRPADQLRDRVLELACMVADRQGEPRPLPGDVQVVDGRGPGHGIASPEGDRAAALALRSAGLVLDPVYTAKALAALPAIAAGRPALFWHTGGLLDAVAALLREST
jgi:1-aminocyclopropane-1-carboxylate deaminase/D-cysteine desulfhydrase-like pyridoxal-dependent ACC family enzyme